MASKNQRAASGQGGRKQNRPATADQAGVASGRGQSTEAGQEISGDADGSNSVDSSKSTAGLKVTSKVEGFRRAGRAWSTEPTVIGRSDLTADELEQLMAEPMLLVESDEESGEDE